MLLAAILFGIIGITLAWFGLRDYEVSKKYRSLFLFFAFCFGFLTVYCFNESSKNNHVITKVDQQMQTELAKCQRGDLVEFVDGKVYPILRISNDGKYLCFYNSADRAIVLMRNVKQIIRPADTITYYQACVRMNRQ